MKTALANAPMPAKMDVMPKARRANAHFFVKADATKSVPNAPAKLASKAHHVMKTRADVPA